MGRHSAGAQGKLAPSVVLGLTVASVGVPLLVVANIPMKARGEEINTEASVEAFQSLPVGIATSSRPPNRKSTTTRPPTSRPAPTVSTHPRPTVAERQIQKSATSTSTTVQRTVRTTTTPQPQIARRTTTTQAVLTKSTPTPQIRTTTPPPSKPKPTTTTSSVTEPPLQPSSTQGERIVAVAKTYVGRNLPYRYGGDSLTTGIDCSHFIYRVLTEAGLKASYRSSSALASWTTRTTNPQPGDLVLYQGHAGIYAGNGMMVHHGRSGGAFFVKVYTQNFIGYGRIPN